MSTTAPAPTNGHDRKINGVRTYRGRKLEDLIPKIRAELGPDAIILREREGLMGGINGFFAQRFVEVEARAGAPRVDVYDDDDLLDETPPAAPEPSELAAPPTPDAAPAPAEAAPAPARAAPAPAQAAPAPEDPQMTPPTTQPLSPADTFAQQLEQAAAAAFENFAIDEPEPVVPEIAPEPIAELASRDAAPAAETPRPARKPRATPKPRAGAKPRAAAKSRTAARPEQVEDVPEPIADLMPTPVEAPIADLMPTPVEAAIADLMPTPVEAPVASPPRRSRRGASVRLARALGGAGAANKQSPAAAQRPVDSGSAAAVARELVQSGISEAWAFQLIGEAGAHGAPFAHQGGLRAAVRSAVASSIVHARPLPATGAAIAFVGAGGAGKTRCAATLAAAYKAASTLAVSPVSLASTDGGRELTELLRGENVAVSSAKDAATLARRVEKARNGGLVVIDTPAVAPGDQVAVHRLASELEPLSLDAIFVVLPATLGAQTGKRLLAGLAPLRPTGLAISHADETDQLGIAVELAWASRIPVSYIHEGLDLHVALSATDPFGLASRLLP